MYQKLSENNPRIPRKAGQPAKSKKHSDLYTDEDPKGTIHGLKFATVEDAKASVNKIKRSGRSHAHKIQAAVAMEQRAKVAGKTSAAAVYRSFINDMKEKTKKMRESLWANIKKKRDRIARGSGEKMRKKGDKGAPTPDQIRRAQEDFTQAPKPGSRPGSIKRKASKYLGKGAGDKVTVSDADKLLRKAKQLKDKGQKERGTQLFRQAMFIKNMAKRRKS